MKNDLANLEDDYANTDEYYVKYADDLYCLSELVNSGTKDFSGKKVVLVKDINMSDKKSFQNNSMYYDYDNNTPNSFNPIGNTSNNFRGTFKGIYNDDRKSETHMYTISNLTINESGSTYVGLFGLLGSGARVGEFNFSGASITGRTGVGGIAGRSNSGTIYSMNIEGLTVTGTDFVGGIVGDNNAGTIEELSVRATVSGTDYIGGVIGYSTGTVNGIYSISNVSGSSHVGGLSGSWYGTIKGVVDGGDVTSSGSGGKVSGYGTGTGLVYVSSALEITRTTTLARHYTNGNADVYVSDGNGYNKDYHSMGMFDDILDTVYGGSTGDYYFDYDENDKYVLKKVNTHSFDTTISGSGTSSDPYILASEKDFKDAVILLSTGNYYFKIANNLDISTFAHFYNLGTYSNPFNGHIDGNNKTISNMNLNGGHYGGFIGYLSSGSVKDLTINNSTINGRYGNNSSTGLLIGISGTITVSNIVFTNISNVSGQTNTGAFIGQLGSSSNVVNTPNISGMTITGTSYVGGLFGNIGSNSTITNLQDITGITVTGSSGDRVGGIVGNISSGVNIGGFDLTNSTISGRNIVGGIAGTNMGKIYSINIEGVTASGTSSVGGAVGHNNSGTIEELSVRATVTGNEYVGGVVGDNAGTTKNVYSVSNVTGSRYVGGLSGTWYGTIYGVVDGGSVIASTVGGKASGYGSAAGLIYVSSALEITRTTTLAQHYTNGNADVYVSDGTSYDSDNSNLEYYGSIKYTQSNTQYPLLDSTYTGDVNNTGWWFSYDANGLIRVVRVGSTTPTPNPPVCETNCTNQDTYPLDTISTNSGTCPEGVTDTTAPTCTFNYFVPVTNGIRASFSCTDDTSVPTIASMFNATTKESYTYDMIIDEERGGTVKTGTVSGNTRSVTSTWTTAYSGPKPQRGLCYYYQLAARDQCNNESNYVTTYCYYGFSNPE